MCRDIDALVGGQNVLNYLDFARIPFEVVVVNGNVAETAFNRQSVGQNFPAEFFKIFPPFSRTDYGFSNICAARKLIAQKFGGSQVVAE